MLQRFSELQPNFPMDLHIAASFMRGKKFALLQQSACLTQEIFFHTL